MLKKVNLASKLINFKSIMTDKQKNRMKLTYYYRYGSLFFSSIFYLAGNFAFPMILKLGIIALLLIVSCLIVNIQIRYNENKRIMKLTVVFEALIVTAVFLFTGGTGSPFVWYGLTPILISSIVMTSYYNWIVLTIYLFSITLITFINNSYEKIISFNVVFEDFNTIAGMILFTILFHLTSSMFKKLDVSKLNMDNVSEINMMLQNLNKLYSECIRNLTTLHKVADDLMENDIQYRIAKTFADSAAKLTKTELSFHYICPDKEVEEIIALNNEEDELLKFKILSDIKILFSKRNFTDDCAKVLIAQNNFLIAPVKVFSKIIGLIGIQVECSCCNDMRSHYMAMLTFLAELSGRIVEKKQTQEITEYYLLSEEHNRIALDVRNYFSEKMLSIKYTANNIVTNVNNTPREEIQNYLKEIQESADKTVSELYSVIYRLKDRKKCIDTFTSCIKNYLDGFSETNNVAIDLNISGNEDEIPMNIKKTIYSVIHEAVSNAVYHGKCKKINIGIQISVTVIKLSIADNGKGFVTNSSYTGGTGIKRMKNMVASLNGKLSLSSNPGNGAGVYITIPNGNEYYMEAL